MGIDQLITSSIQGKETGLPLPRFVSLKAKRTNMRIGPSFDHKISWVFIKPGVPVEVVEEFEVWRRIRDADGKAGWVHKAMLSGKRKAIVAPWAVDEYFSLFQNPSETASLTAKLEAGVYTDLEECEDRWCRLEGKTSKGHRFSGWVKSDEIWGVYPGEDVR